MHESTLAIVLEPTDLTIQAGCLGNVVARLTFAGTSGHAARPWLADSALARAIRGLEPLLDVAPRSAVVERPRVQGSAVAHAARERDRGQRHPGARHGDAQPPLPAGPDARRGRGVPRLPRPGGSDARGREQQPACGASSSTAPAVRALQAGRRSRRSSPSRHGRTSPTSRRAGSTRSTSAPGTRRSRTIREERVAIDSLVTAYEVAPALRHESDRRRCRVMELAERDRGAVGGGRARPGADRGGRSPGSTPATFGSPSAARTAGSSTSG